MKINWVFRLILKRYCFISSSTYTSTYAYTYYVEEEDVPDGYTVIYSDNNAAGVTGGIITVTNRSTSPIAPLPTTGGRGIRSSPRIIGISLSAAAVISGFMYMLLPDFRKKRKRAR